MVDYNNQATVSTPPGDVLKIAILERRAYFINAYEQLKKIESRGGDIEVYVARGALAGLYMELEGALEGDMPPAQLDKVKAAIASTKNDDIKELLAAFSLLNKWMYGKNLTKFDTKRNVPTYDIEATNKSHGI